MALSSRVSSRIKARSDVVTFISAKLHSPAPIHVEVTRAMAVIYAHGSGEFGGRGLAKPLMPERNASIWLGFIASPGNLDLTGSAPGRNVNRSRTNPWLDVLKTQMIDFGMVVQADICCQK